MSKEQEKRERKEGLNSPSLMEGYQAVLNQDKEANQEEFSEEISQGLMSTYNQLLDSFRQGTIDGKKQDREA